MYDRELTPVGLRVTQYSLLVTLRREAGDGMPLGELADRMEMDRSTLTRNLKPLIERGWAKLTLAGHDARVRYAIITAAGKTTLQEAEPHWRRAQHTVNETLGKSSVADLHRWLDTVVPMFRPIGG